MKGRAYAVAAAVCILAAIVGLVAWTAHAGDVRAQVARAGALGAGMISGHVASDTIARSLAAPSLNVAVEDRVAGHVYVVQDDVLAARPLPPGPPAGPGEGGPPPEARMRSVFARFGGPLSGIVPIRIGDGDRAVRVGPNADAIGRYFAADAALVLAIWAIAFGVAVRVESGRARAERRRLEATLEERRAAAAEFQRFLADAGHELRTPLTVVSGYADLLATAVAGDERAERMLAEMRAEAARMRALVEKMLMLARLESPVSVPHLIDVLAVVRDAAASVRAAHPDRSIEVRSSGDASVVIDADDLYEAVRNLVENAVRYAPGSPVIAEVSARDGAVHVVVSDRGEGIAPDEREKIFDRFYRGRDRSGGDGSGLGLSIVSRVAERWNGRIALRSEPGETAFDLSFPLAEEEPA